MRPMKVFHRRLEKLQMVKIRIMEQLVYTGLVVGETITIAMMNRIIY